MKLPTFLRRRSEQRAGYTDSVVAALLEQAASTSNVQRTAAVEIAAGIWGRAFASAQIEGTDAVTPSLLESWGRSLVKVGEFVCALDIDGGRLALVPASSWDVSGDSPMPGKWTYRVDVPTPQGIRPRRLPGAGVIHGRVGVDPHEPWRGIPATHWAKDSATLAANLELRASEEAYGPSAMLIPAPIQINEPDDDDNTSNPLEGLSADLLKAKGSFVVAESMSGGWGEHQSRQSRADDWAVRRLGADFPAANIALRRDVLTDVLSMHGVPPILATVQGDGGAKREGYRQLLHATIAPVARIIAAELSVKLETEVSISFDELGAADIQGRARAFGSLVTAGMTTEDAAAVTGLA